MYFVVEKPDDKKDNWTGPPARIAQLDFDSPHNLKFVLPGEDRPWEVSVCSKSGNFAVVTSRTPEEQIHLVDRTSGLVTKLTIDMGSAEWPLFSSNGSTVSFLSHVNGEVNALTTSDRNGEVQLFKVTP
jgi:hypothetical protein